MVKKFNMTNIDAMVTYEKFYKKYPNGEINKEQFMEVTKFQISNDCHLFYHYHVRITRRTL